MKPIRMVLAAVTLAAAPVAAFAYDKPPTTPPGSGSPTPVPAPAALGLFALGVAGLAIARNRRR